MNVPIRAILFDKDGTLFDFAATWTGWIGALLRDLSRGEEEVERRLAQALEYDATAKALRPHSVAIAGTPFDIARVLAPILKADPQRLVEDISARAEMAPMVEAVPLAPLLADLRARGLTLGVATNDSHEVALANLAACGVRQAFDFVVGSDCGFGAKPAPGMCTAFARQVSVLPEAVVMVGDSLHDLRSGRAAGMRTVAVLTGIAGADDLRPFADVVLPDIGHLPEWLDRVAG